MVRRTAITPRFWRAALLAVTAVISCVSASAASAGTVRIADGTAVFAAGPNETNVVTTIDIGGVPSAATQLAVSDLGAPLTAGPGCVASDANAAICPEDPAAQRSRLFRAHFGDGADRYSGQGERQLSLYGGPGADKLETGSQVGQTPTMGGGPGNRSPSRQQQRFDPGTLRGGWGDDTLRGGREDFGGPGADTLREGSYGEGAVTARRDFERRGWGRSLSAWRGAVPRRRDRPRTGVDTLHEFALRRARSLGTVLGMRRGGTGAVTGHR